MMKKSGMAFVLTSAVGLWAAGSVQGCTGGDDDDSGGSSSSSSSTGGTSSSSSSSSTGGTSSSSSSTGGSSGTSGGSSGTSSSSSSSSTGGSSGTSGGSSGTSGGSSGTSSGGNGLGSLCGGGTGCEGIPSNGVCLTLGGATQGVCAVNNGCTAAATNCDGAGTLCIALTSGTACVKSCTFTAGNGQCGTDAACVPYTNGDLCLPKALSECDAVAGTGCTGTQTCSAAGTDGFGACIESCDIFATPSGCPSNQGCYLSSSGVGCAPAGTGTADQTCSAANGCVSGLICVGTCKTPCDSYTGGAGTHTCTTGTCQKISNADMGVCN